MFCTAGKSSGAGWGGWRACKAQDFNTRDWGLRCVSHMRLGLGNKRTLVMVREKSFCDLANMFIKNVSLFWSLCTIVFILSVELNLPPDLYQTSTVAVMHRLCGPQDRIEESM